MKHTLFLIILLRFTPLWGNGPDQVISCHFHASSFAEFSNVIFLKSGVKIYYQENWVSPVKVTMDEDSITVLTAVELAIRNTDLQVSVWNNDLVLLPGERLIDTIPSYIKPQIKTDSSTQQENTLTESEERYITGRRGDVIRTIQVGEPGGHKTNGKCSITGRVLDIDTGEPVSYITMFISELNTGIMADAKGFLSISLRPGKYNTVFEFLGYEKRKYLLEVYSDGEFTIQINKAVIQMKEFIVHGDRQMSVKSKDPGMDKILMKTIKEVPMMMGERNILSVSALLPGIVNTGEGSAGLNVRGGGSDQNAFYLNKIPVYNTSHLFGFFPAFNSDMIKDFSIYKGYIPSQFGGRLSSVFDITTRQGNMKHFTAHGGVSPITGNLVVEGPIKKDTCSVLLSARSSYSDWMLKQLHDPTIRQSSAHFSDFSGGINYDIQKVQASLFVYHSFDHFRLADLNDYNYSNNGAALSFTHRRSGFLRGEYTLIASEYKFNTTDKQEVSAAYEHAYKMRQYEARADYRNITSDKNTLDYGADISFYDLDRGDVIPYGIESLHSRVSVGRERGIESGLYISDAYDVNDRLNVRAGFRFGLFNPLGPKTVYTYGDDSPRDIRYIRDSLEFGQNEVIRWYTQPDLRLAFQYETDDNGSVKLSFNQMHQNLFQLNNTITIAPNTQWKLADYHLKPSSGIQMSLGIFRVLPHKGLEASAEVYYKHINHYPEFKDGADFLGSPLVETAVLQGTQKAYGIEFFLKRTNRRLEGWLSYTYSHSMVRVDDQYVWNQINNGKLFPANFDIPHSLSVVGSYHFTRRLTLSSIISYQTGKPVTYPVSVYYVNGVPTLDYSSRNAYRIPNYFRTDISLTLEGNLKKNKAMHSTFSLNLYNLSARENPYSVYFKIENGGIRSYRYAVIGVPVFSASWIFKLGNYASE
jgi:hypothetical protein